jgi:NitT/TauT family transport system ATP-binding protein
MLRFNEVTKVYKSVSGGRITALEGLDLTLRENEFLCIVGLSGCGKTTTLRLAAGLETPTHGEILLNGKKVEGPSPERCVVFQKYTLFPWRTVLKNVTFGLENTGADRRERTSIAQKYLNLVGLSNYAEAYPYELSGGMQQRVAVARALALDPKVLLMDEPFGALDARTREVLQNELIRIREKDKKTILFVTHSIKEAVYLADRIVVMQSSPGRILDVIEVDLPRPREKSDEKFIRCYDRVHSLLREG